MTGPQFAAILARRAYYTFWAYVGRTPASAVELTDPDGRYAYLPLVAGALDRDNERTRGPWTSTHPRRRNALQRARRAIHTRKTRHDH
jgi:hypothetical protein